ncbi:hypothetical protein [Sphingomonas yantingensis]|jgi:hypothetical protein|uniref:DUF600 family protein n=2 Tax=Sphingomonas TaxID=13687 RepID=A0A7W9EIT2_9SPHN|nr:hypothetical protein [Sphingomonas yantingensis]MBB5699507.1 hypothetical protein [Sphingomonas yantingensis]HCB74617.1 hypothetical protein [Sphingomonas bacterium]
MVTDGSAPDAALHALCQAIVGDIVYATRDWELIVLVFELEGRTRDFGYVFETGDRWEAETPENWDVLSLAKAFRASTAQPGAPGWKKCLLRIERASGAVQVDFDHSGEKWQPDYADPAAFARRLRDWPR